MSVLRTAALAALMLSLPGIGGCSRFQSDYESGHRPIADSRLSALRDMAQALELLGPPTKLGRAGAGTVFLYETVSVRETQFGINLGYDWLNIFKAVVAKGDVETETLTLVFDRDGTIVSQPRSAENRNIGYGGAFQLIIKVVPIVDSADYTALSPQHRWGHGLSEPVPVMLNAPYSVRQGEGGVGRVGTPDEVGQETLGPVR